MVVYEKERQWIAFEQLRGSLEAIEVINPKFEVSNRRSSVVTSPKEPMSRASRRNSANSWTPEPSAPSHFFDSQASRRTKTQQRPLSPTLGSLAPLKRAASEIPSLTSNASVSSAPPERRDKGTIPREQVPPSRQSTRPAMAGIPKPKTILERVPTAGTINNSGSGQKGTDSVLQEHGQSARNEVEVRGRGRSRSRADIISPTAQPAGRSSSQTRRQSSGTEGRSSSQTRRQSSGTEPELAGRSDSLTRKRLRGRSASRTGLPPTRPSSRSRNRSRSASLTRITNNGVAVSPATGTGKTDRTKTKPPSTSRSRRTMRENSSNSLGSQRDRAPTEESNIDVPHDANIGRDISLPESKSATAKHNEGKRDKVKKGGLMQKLFGDPVTRPAHLKPGDFDYEIRPRILLAATVYHNTATNLWITTINTNQRGVAKNPTLANKYLKAFSFPTEREARESAIANAPPKMVPFTVSPVCFLCSGQFAVFRRASHCRNCGVSTCSNCSTIWPAKMIPATYNLKNEATVKICNCCDKLSAAFKKALLAGNYEDAVALYGTGNINLRTPFPVHTKKGEVLYPIHCAVEGGNLDILRWLIDDHFCPIKLVKTGGGSKASQRNSSDVPIMTSKGRSIFTIAMERLNIDILRYLVVECAVSVYDATDLKLSLRALESALSALPDAEGGRRRRLEDSFQPARWDKASFDEMSEPSSLGNDEFYMDENGTIGSKSNLTKGSRSDVCIICFERKIDCVATPCGHQLCCLECSRSLMACPVCSNQVEFIKIFRP